MYGLVLDAEAMIWPHHRIAKGKERRGKIAVLKDLVTRAEEWEEPSMSAADARG